jgi:hypothetical protein
MQFAGNKQQSTLAALSHYILQHRSRVLEFAISPHQLHCSGNHESFSHTCHAFSAAFGAYNSATRGIRLIERTLIAGSLLSRSAHACSRSSLMRYTCTSLRL